MIEATALSSWEGFYVIVGSSAAALTGLQFVVIALIAETEARRGLTEVDAFGTPNVVHFSAVLLIAAMLTAPWPKATNVAIPIGISGALGVIYGLIVTRRARRTTLYKPVLEDWVFHVVLPLAAYAVLATAALTLPRYLVSSLFAIAASSVLLLFVGIHNAWDTVTYVALRMAQPPANTTAEATATGEDAQPRASSADARGDAGPSNAPNPA